MVIAFVLILVQIAYGLIGGIGSYLILWTVFTLLEKLGIPKPTFESPTPKEGDDSASDQKEEPEEKAKDFPEAIEGDADEIEA